MLILTWMLLYVLNKHCSLAWTDALKDCEQISGKDQNFQWTDPIICVDEACSNLFL